MKITVMIRFVSTILVSAVMLAHGLLGCCWHHAHDYEVELSAGAHEEHAFQEHEHCRHHHGQHASHSPDEPAHENCPHEEGEQHDHPFQTCEEGQCTFIASGNVKLPNCLQSVSFDVFPFHSDPLVVAIAQQGFMPISGFTDLHLAQPLCAQPLTQVWLL